jgi:hypothetical protein
VILILEIRPDINAKAMRTEKTYLFGKDKLSVCSGGTRFCDEVPSGTQNAKV